MRGKGRTRKSRIFCRGITPAYAGKSMPSRVIFSSNSGSPPPMRGKGIELITELDNLRITPAYAGKSLAAVLQR